MIYIHYLSTKYVKLKRHPTNSEIICRLRCLFCIFRTLSHRWQSKQQRFNDYYDYYCLLKYRDSTQYWNIENYFVTWHLIDARLFWLLLWQQLTLILIHNYLFFLHCLSLSHNALCLSLWIIVRFYWTIIVWFFLIVTLDDSIDLTRNSPAFGCTKHTHTNYYYHHRRRCRRYRHRRRRGNGSIVVVVIRRRFCC